MVKLRNNEPISSQQSLQKTDEGITHARSFIALSRENQNTEAQILSNGHGTNAVVYGRKSKMDPLILMQQMNDCSLTDSPVVPLRLTCPDANTNSQMARVLCEISNPTKENGESSPATQVAAAFHRWKYSHRKVEQRLQIKLLKAIERAEKAEATVERRTVEINRLKEDLRKMEEEKNKIITNLQAKIGLLQTENDCGVQNVVGQLAVKSQEPPSYLLKRSNLDSQLGIKKRKLAQQIKGKVNSPDGKDTRNFNFCLEVSLYNELQKLQDLIVKEAQLHQEKVKENKGATNREEIASNASPFSTSLWRICNGLAHCLIEARNQILALAGNSDSKTCQKLTSMNKVCKKSKILTNKGNDKTYQRLQFRFLKTAIKCKEEKWSYKSLECESKRGAGDAEILEFVGAGKVATQKVSELGTRHGSLMESRTHVDLTNQ